MQQKKVAMQESGRKLQRNCCNAGKWQESGKKVAGNCNATCCAAGKWQEVAVQLSLPREVAVQVLRCSLCFVAQLILQVLHPVGLIVDAVSWRLEIH